MFLFCVATALPLPDSVVLSRFRNIESTTEELVLDTLTNLIWARHVYTYPPFAYTDRFTVLQNASKLCEDKGMRLPSSLEVMSITDVINRTNDLSDIFVGGINGFRLTGENTIYNFAGHLLLSQGLRGFLALEAFGWINDTYSQYRYHCISRNTRLEFPVKNLTNETFQLGNLVYRRKYDYVNVGQRNESYCSRYEGMRVVRFNELVAIFNDTYRNLLPLSIVGCFGCRQSVHFAIHNTTLVSNLYLSIGVVGMISSSSSNVIYLCVKEIEPPKIKTRSRRISATKSKAILSPSSTLISPSKSMAQSRTTTYASSRTRSTKQLKTKSQEMSRSPTTVLLATKPTLEPTTQQSTSSTTIEQATSTSILSTTHQTSLITSIVTSQGNSTTILPTTLKQRTRTLLPPPIVIPVVRLSQQEQTATSSVSAVSLVASSSAILTSRMSALIQPACGDDSPQEITRFQSPLLLEIGGSKRVGLIVGNIAIFSVVTLTHFLLSRWKHFPNAFISPMPELTIFSYFLEPNLGTLVAMIQDGEYIAIPFLFVIIGSPPLFFWIISRKFTGTWHKRDQKKSSFFLGVGKWSNFAIWECAYGDYRGTDLPNSPLVSKKDSEEDPDTLSGKFVWKK